MSFICAGPAGFSISNCELFIWPASCKKEEPIPAIVVKDCKQFNKNETTKNFSNAYTITRPYKTLCRQYPITVLAKIVIASTEPRPRSTIPRIEHMIKDLCFNDDLSDCKIVCEEQSFPCHKFILSLRSDVFKTMFQNMDLNEGMLS